ncbi:cupin domain protein [bacterium BMS3Abin03]|nr:cupin domain protein [bacterium BMS3Abin03]
MLKKNLFENIPGFLSEEIIETLIESDNVKVERIISKGHSSPKGFWYDQEENEWVIVLKGSAKLIFEENNLIELNAYDYINIPAHKKHRIEWTDPNTETIWLAIFY